MLDATDTEPSKFIVGISADWASNWFICDDTFDILVALCFKYSATSSCALVSLVKVALALESSFWLLYKAVSFSSGSKVERFWIASLSAFNSLTFACASSRL